ncbi:MAG: 4-(cytidine 5'-diphospho)-2-C-methyl-D-erythritol kinase [Burkholderiaceae bacterium]|jgi:4-diphosphocytidyl-2-C-methyl-D-erythritol kinase|nr:4-(cytidine 5'-diphospho)-2-C-methyl-D-erythritol kinase [Burkholderiaceae bacterium]
MPRALWDIPAPAKLNLFLHVTGRRPDGYHLLQSAFMLIDWCDTLHFERTASSRITREDLGAPLPQDDLTVRAARALQTATGCTQGVRIGVLKRIPAQAGMGGGSSDAASALLALNRLWRLGLNRDQLTQIGLPLGADVPFFVRGRNAWVEGVGECIRPIDLPAAHFLVAKPLQGLDTAAIFSAPALTRDTAPATIAHFVADPYGFGRNDLQPVAQTLCPGVALSLDWLARQGLSGRMTGSGSAVFARFPGAVAPQPPGQDWQVRICGNLPAHPLYGWAASGG